MVKRWLKKHWRPVVIGVLLLPTANAIYGIIQAVKLGNDLYLVIHTFGLVIFSFLLLIVSGVADRIHQWWERD